MSDLKLGPSDLATAIRNVATQIGQMASALRDIAVHTEQLMAPPVGGETPPLPVPPVGGETPPLPDLIDAVPYRSQWDRDGNSFTSDCGPACIAMILEYYGKRMDINQISIEAGMVGNRKFTLPADLIVAASLHGVKMVRRFPWDVPMLAAEIAARRPVIVLIHYGSLDAIRQDRNYARGHWVVVVGVDDKNVYIHDPDWQALHRDQGRALPLPRAIFEMAWAACNVDGNTPNQALCIVTG